MGNTQRSVQVLVNQDDTAGQGPSPVHPLDLQRQVLKADGVIAVDGVLKLEREDQAQILAHAGQKRAAPLRRCNLKAAIELGAIVFP
jgi:hypothetical protein